MDLQDKMKNFNKRWDITSSDSYEEAFKKFKQRILNIFTDIDSHVTQESVKMFCQYYGIPVVWRRTLIRDSSLNGNIANRLLQEDDEREFYRLIELIFTLDITSKWDHNRRISYSRGLLLREAIEVIGLSSVNVAITSVNGEVILYPKGEKELDSKLVNYTLTFLNREAGEHFVQSLQFYQAKNPIKSAESLRRTLEEFLRFKLNNSKGLNANITELRKILKGDERDAQVRNIILQTFSCLDQYFNENSKHNDGDIDDPENEFLIYQVGLGLRYINRVIN
jgi:hypothetical protein